MVSSFNQNLSKTSLSQSSTIQEGQSQSLELHLQQLKKEFALLEENQRAFDQRIRYRKCGAETTSCLCCPFTCIGTLIPCVLCYPCICYRILNNKGDCLDQCMQSIGCVSHIRPPENNRELCCTYLTPIFMDLPDLNSRNGSDFYSLPHERADERARYRTIYDLAVKTRAFKTEIIALNLKTPDREEMV